MDRASIESLLQGVLRGELTVAAAADQLGGTHLRTARIDHAEVDVARADRCGMPEVVYGPGKTPETVVAIFRELLSAGQHCLATRVTVEQAQAVKSAFQNVIWNETARTVRLMTTERSPLGCVAVVSAGTSDLPVALEVQETLLWLECEADLIVDVGVAGPQRLLARVDQLRQADSLVVVAGMEGALPSVVAGHVACPVFAVPTSVGYGASLGGIAALLSMLNSCAANVAVVNIDAGFKAGCLAGMVARATARSSDGESSEQ